jgi:hypothetical protein
MNAYPKSAMALSPDYEAISSEKSFRNLWNFFNAGLTEGF